MLATFDSNFTLCDYLQNRNLTNSDFYDDELLRRAKLGLESLAFFGLAEQQVLNHMLFRKTFAHKLQIKDSRIQNLINAGKNKPLSFEIIKKLNASTIKRIASVNKLDIELYRFAVKLFYDRLVYFNIGFINK
jgi:hypothetical protein